MKRDSILIVDDEAINRIILEEIFQTAYNVLQAGNGKEALEVLRGNHSRVAAILLDIEMPEMNGFAFLDEKAKIQNIAPIPVIVVTADDTNANHLKAYERGVYDVVRKPYHPKIVFRRVKNIVSLFAYQERLEDTVEEQNYRLEEQERNFARVNEKLLESLSAVVEFRDSETGEHIQRIKQYTEIICYKMLELYPGAGLDEHKINLIVSAAPLHDIGKICIPDSILLKPGRLTPEEFDVIKTHSEKGASMLSKIQLINSNEYLEYCKNICLYHHEKYDGKGYPKGLIGEEIPLEAQIVSIADVFDALVSKRVYKDAVSIDEAAQMIIDGECGAFSERLLDCFKASMDYFRRIITDSMQREHAV